MKLTALFTGLLALASACPPPFNNPDFRSNATHNTSDIIAARLDQMGPNTGWTEAVKMFHNKETVWPANDGKTTITYCYLDESAKRKYSCLIGAGLTMWRDKLGPPGKDTGHSLEIREVPLKAGEHENPYCLDAKGNWNFDRVPSGTLQIVPNEFGHPGSFDTTLGFIQEENNNRPDRHSMAIPEDIDCEEIPGAAESDKFVVAHEFGHAMGLFHEHQREDRDTWESFRCESVRNYDRTLRAIEAEGHDPSYMKEVCDDPVLGYKYDFEAPQFSKHDYPYSDGTHRRVGTGPFDVTSVMIYHGHTFINPDIHFSYDDDNTWPNSVLCIWLPLGSGSAGKERTKENCRPFFGVYISDQDREGVKYLYPAA